jgi:hypothetical protein
LIYEKRSYGSGSASKRCGFAFVFGRCAEKSMISGATHGFWVSKRFDSGCFQVGQALGHLEKPPHDISGNE